MNQQLLKEIQRITPVYDPLIIYVNKNFVLPDGTESIHIGIKGRDFGEYVRVMYDRMEVPNMYSKHNAYSCIVPITKHSLLQADYRTARKELLTKYERGVVMNCIDCNITKEDALRVMQIKYPRIFGIVVNDWDHYYNLYLDSKK